MSEDSDRLFAYGTLRSGGEMHALLARDVTLIGAARYSGRLYDLGVFPGVVPAERPDDVVHGELFALPASTDVRAALLDTLDRYEGRSFERVVVEVTGPAGVARAWLFLFRGDVDRGRLVGSGDFIAHRAPVTAAGSRAPRA